MVEIGRNVCIRSWWLDASSTHYIPIAYHGGILWRESEHANGFLCLSRWAA